MEVLLKVASRVRSLRTADISVGGVSLLVGKESFFIAYLRS